MERKRQESGESSLREQDTELTVYEAIRRIAEYNANADLDNEHQLLLFLQSWWSKTYNRPLKDPLLQEYTLEELLYEFYDKVERARAQEIQVEESTDRIEEDKIKQNLDWAEQEEQRELEELRKAQEKAAEIANPAEDPANKAWMQEVMDKEIQNAKEIYGDDFGEDINEDFDG